MSLLVETMTSPSRISYPRDFLLQYQKTTKDEPTIVEKLKPYLSPPHKTKQRTPIKKDVPSPPFALRSKNDQTPIERGPKHPKKRNTPKDLKTTDKENMGLPRPKIVPSIRSDKRAPLAPLLTPVQQISPYVRLPSSSRSLETPKAKTLSTYNASVCPSPLSPSLPYVPPMMVPRTPALPEVEVTNAGSISAKMSASKLLRKKPEMSSLKKTPAPAAAPIRNLASSHPSPKSTIKATNNMNSPLSSSVKGISSVKSNSSPNTARRTPSPLDAHRISQRQKQINYGHNTVGYLRYMLMVPRECRTPENPRTPKKEQACSKRSWDGQLKKWRRELHLWDPEDPEAFKAMLESDLVKSMLLASQELAKIFECVKDKIGKETEDENEEDEKDEKEGDVPVNELPAVPEVKQAEEEQEVKNTSVEKADKIPVARTLVF
jgi:hypothetical protein